MNDYVWKLKRIIIEHIVIIIDKWEIYWYISNLINKNLNVIFLQINS